MIHRQEVRGLRWAWGEEMTIKAFIFAQQESLLRVAFGFHSPWSLIIWPLFEKAWSQGEASSEVEDALITMLSFISWLSEAPRISCVESQWYEVMSSFNIMMTCVSLSAETFTFICVQINLHLTTTLSALNFTDLLIRWPRCVPREQTLSATRRWDISHCYSSHTSIAIILLLAQDGISLRFGLWLDFRCKSCNFKWQWWLVV